MQAKYTPEAMRARLAELDAEAAAIEKQAAPLRRQRAALREKMAPLEAEERALVAHYREIEKPLFDIDQERAIIARALGGKALRADPARGAIKGGK
ncbi:MAG: hypothetical protein AB7R90_19505 [Reyranellaceae bacterium]